jgi:dipeptidyl aminopeptidase/acylaminoacyl peptidase
MVAVKSYVTLRVNYRGSRGHGKSFAKAARADWDDKEVEDLKGTF